MPHIVLFLALPCLSLAAGSFTFSSIFSNGMTLQSGDSPAARVWGWTDPGATVTVYQRNFNHTGSGGWAHPYLACTTTARPSDGLWVAQLPPTPAGGPWRLEFYAVSSSLVSVANATLDWLWFGDVFLGSAPDLPAKGRARSQSCG